MMLRLALAIISCASIAAFRMIPTSSRMIGVRRFMSDTEQGAETVDSEADIEGYNYICDKMEADSNYNPLKDTDPKVQAVLEKLIPKEWQEFPGVLNRLKVALTDATSGSEASTLEELSKYAKDLGPKEMISSPNSDWFKEGCPDEGPIDVGELKKLREQLLQEFPYLANK